MSTYDTLKPVEIDGNTEFSCGFSSNMGKKYPSMTEINKRKEHE